MHTRPAAAAAAASPWSLVLARELLAPACELLALVLARELRELRELLAHGLGAGSRSRAPLR